MDKTKFTINPHLDSEGFVMADAKCWGCAPHEPCSRSGYCERYTSPLRLMQGESVTVTVTDGKVLTIPNANMAEDARINLMLANAHLDGINPRGWNEPGMAPITWAEIEPGQHHDQAEG